MSLQGSSIHLAHSNFLSSSIKAYSVIVKYVPAQKRLRRRAFWQIKASHMNVIIQLTKNLDGYLIVGDIDYSCPSYSLVATCKRKVHLICNVRGYYCL